MKRKYTQKELYDLLCSNPLNKKVYINEADPPDGEDYIFLDYLGNPPIPMDNGAFYLKTIQIQVYMDDIDEMNRILLFLQMYFVAHMDQYKENGYNVATFSYDVILNG